MTYPVRFFKFLVDCTYVLSEKFQMDGKSSISLKKNCQENGSVACLEKLLNDHRDYDAAELFCIYTDTSEHVLQLTLLKFYLQNVT